MRGYTNDGKARANRSVPERKETTMLFIGHFSFDEIDADSQSKHGYFSSIVDAQSPDDAVAKFEAHIRQMKDSTKQMVSVVNVYIEEILKIANIPETPIITRLQSSEGEFPASISHSLPGVFGEDVEAFGFAPDVEDHEMLNDGGFIEAKPFITFDH
jgi:hypothetical protein